MRRLANDHVVCHLMSFVNNEEKAERWKVYIEDLYEVSKLVDVL